MDLDNEAYILAWTFSNFVTAYALSYMSVMRVLCSV